MGWVLFDSGAGTGCQQPNRVGSLGAILTVFRGVKRLETTRRAPHLCGTLPVYTPLLDEISAVYPHHRGNLEIFSVECQESAVCG